MGASKATSRPAAARIGWCRLTGVGRLRSLHQELRQVDRADAEVDPRQALLSLTLDAEVAGQARLAEAHLLEGDSKQLGRALDAGAERVGGVGDRKRSQPGLEPGEPLALDAKLQVGLARAQGQAAPGLALELDVGAGAGGLETQRPALAAQQRLHGSPGEVQAQRLAQQLGARAHGERPALLERHLDTLDSDRHRGLEAVGELGSASDEGDAQRDQKLAQRLSRALHVDPQLLEIALQVEFRCQVGAELVDAERT